MNGSDSLKCRFASGTDAAQLLNSTLKLGEGLSGWVAKNRRTLVNADPRVTFERLGLPEPRLRSALVCPLYVNDTFIGCLSLYHLEANRYTDDHRRLLERIAEQAGPVIHNSIVFEQTQEDSLTDPLTGLPNRRSMFVHLSRELARADRLKRQMALIVMDLDGFKTINDTYGHHIGDRALAPSSSGPSCRSGSVRSKSRSAPASGCGWRRAPAPQCSRTTVPITKRCSPRPITGCIATRPCAAATCRRARRSGRSSPGTSTSQRPSNRSRSRRRAELHIAPVATNGPKTRRISGSGRDLHALRASVACSVM
jgi:hypothetical protein